MFSKKFYVDKHSAHHYYLEDIDRSGWGLRQGNWLKRWNSTYFSVKGKFLYFSNKKNSHPNDVINLMDPDLQLISIGCSSVYHCVISNSLLSTKTMYSLKLGIDPTEALMWKESLDTLVNLRKPEPLVPTTSSNTGVAVQFALEWLTLKEVGLIDAALCNKKLRAVYFTLLSEYSIQFSKAYWDLSIFVNFYVCKWLVDRRIQPLQLATSDSVMQALHWRSLFNLSALTNLHHYADTSILYDVLRNCNQLTSLTLNEVTHSSKLTMALTVWNRKLIQFTGHNPGLKEYNRIEYLFGFHHPCLSLEKYGDVKWQKSRLTLLLHLWYRSVEQCNDLELSDEYYDNVCQRNANISVLTNRIPIRNIGLYSNFFASQRNLTTVHLNICGDGVVNLPSMLASCNSITDLMLVRLEDTPLDWSCFSDSAMMLKTLKITMIKEHFLQHAVKVLRTVQTIVITESPATDEQILKIVEANQNNLTELTVTTSGLTAISLINVGIHCKKCRKLDIREGQSSICLIHFSTVCNNTLVNLTLHSGIIIQSAIQLMAQNFPALRYLTIYCYGGLEVIEAIDVINALGSQLIELRFIFWLQEYVNRVAEHGKSIDKCCKLVLQNHN